MLSGVDFKVYCLGFTFYRLRCGDKGSGFRIWGLGFRLRV